MAGKCCRRRVRGVTATELLGGMVVFGLLVAIAIAVQHAYVIRVNRSDARRDLLALAEQLHRCFARAGDYRVDSAGSRNPCLRLPSTNAEGTYTVSFAPGEPRANGFRLVASPRGAQAADTGCGGLTLDERGNRGITGRGAREACWEGSGD